MYYEVFLSILIIPITFDALLILQLISPIAAVVLALRPKLVYS